MLRWAKIFYGVRNLTGLLFLKIKRDTCSQYCHYKSHLQDMASLKHVADGANFLTEKYS